MRGVIMAGDIRTKALSWLKEMQVVYLSTYDGTFPRVRPMSLMMIDSRFFILTGSSEAKIDQIRENGNVEVCIPFDNEKGNGYIRAKGVIFIIEDRAVKNMVAERTPYFKQYWPGPDDPDFALLELEPDEIEFMSPGDNSSVHIAY